MKTRAFSFCYALVLLCQSAVASEPPACTVNCQNGCLPTCAIVASGTYSLVGDVYEIPSGVPFSAAFTGTDYYSPEVLIDSFFVQTGATPALPSGAVFTPAVFDDSDVPCPGQSGGTCKKFFADTVFSWTPQAADRGSEITAFVTFTDECGHVAPNCSIKLRVKANTPPVCDACGPYQMDCQGTLTSVVPDSTMSYDADGDALTHTYSTTCTGASIVNQVLQLTNPGKGIADDCSLVLKVSDGIDTTECSASVKVSACEVDCLGVPPGTAELAAQLDQCGKCDGNNSCFDCKGVPFGTSVVDKCGVCGGNNAALDRCGVCGGDGTSCLKCEKTEFTNKLFAMDGAGLQQRNAVYRVASQLLRLGKRIRNKAAVAQAKSAHSEAEDLYLKNWNTTWMLPRFVKTCDNPVFCLAASNASALGSYIRNTERLYQLLKEVVKSTVKLRGAKARYGKRLLASGELAYAAALAEAGSFPTHSDECP